MWNSSVHCIPSVLRWKCACSVTLCASIENSLTVWLLYLVCKAMEGLETPVMSLPHCRQLEKDEVRMQPRMEHPVQYDLTHAARQSWSWSVEHFLHVKIPPPLPTTPNTKQLLNTFRQQTWWYDMNWTRSDIIILNCRRHDKAHNHLTSTIRRDMKF